LRPTPSILQQNLKTLFSIPEESTEKSQFTSGAILDESAYSKETILKVVNIKKEAIWCLKIASHACTTNL
jgi:hypothetical protein